MTDSALTAPQTSEAPPAAEAAPTPLPGTTAPRASAQPATPSGLPAAPTEPAEPAPTRRRMPRAEREQQILAVAEEVFAERGFQATSMDEVSLRVGVSKPMLYEYFGSKEGLLLGCVARVRADLQEATIRAVAQAAPHGPRAILTAGLEAYFDFADRHGKAWAVLLNETAIVAGPTEEAIESIRRQQTDMIESLLVEWMPTVAAVRHAAFAHSLIGAGERVARWRLREREAGGGASAAEAATMLVELFWPGLTAAKEAAESGS